MGIGLFDSLSGKKLGAYKILQEIKHTRMGIVYRAYHADDDREVAFKVPLLSELTEERVKRFEREMAFAKALQHPHIVPTYDVGEIDGVHYIAMRFLDGGTLADRVEARQQRREPLLRMPDVLDLIDIIAEALMYAHSQGVVHRDIKPSNILFDKEGNAYLGDFGVAKIIRDEVLTDLTPSGSILGTLVYMAPEQWLEQDITPAADQYALAVVAFQLLTGHFPYEKKTNEPMSVQQLLQFQKDDLRPQPPSKFRFDLPSAVDRVLLKALDRKPHRRYLNVREFAVALRHAIETNPFDIMETYVPESPSLAANAPALAPTPPSLPLRPALAPRPKRTKWFGLAGVIGAVLLGAFMLMNNDGGGGSNDPTLPASNSEVAETPTSPVESAPLLSPQQAAQATLDANATLTAPTPSPILTADFPQQTAIAQATFDQELWYALATLQTHTPTPSLTLSPSYTPSPTLTVTPSLSPTPTPSLAEQALRLATETCVQSNEEWLPYRGIAGVTEREVNGVKMVLVPCGQFVMGSFPPVIEAAVAQCVAGGAIPNCAERFADEQPVQLITITRPFWIDQTEVSNRAYGSSGFFMGEHNPRERLNWEAARLHCEARGGRLPSEAEWEYAARGVSNWTYPWGDTFEAGRVNYTADVGGFADVAPVDAFPGGASWVGALNLLGNVAEWTSSLYRAYPYNATDGREILNPAVNIRVVRGGDWSSNGYDLRSAARSGADAADGKNYIGFRCVMDYQP